MSKRISKKVTLNISPASSKLWSTIYVEGIYPKGNKDMSDTIGLRLTPAQASELAAMLQAVAYDRIAQGDIFITGKKHDQSVTIIRRKKGNHKPFGSSR